MPPLATITDYELLIGPVAQTDVARVDYLLIVGSTVVASVATGALPWLYWDPNNPPIDPSTGLPMTDPGPVPEPVVLVTCQVTAKLVEDPEGAPGAISSERVGWVSTVYDTQWAAQSGLLPASWRLVLKPWRPPDLATVRLTVEHPMEGWWSYYWDDTPEPAPVLQVGSPSRG